MSSFITLPPGATPIVDADEEVFLLYTSLNRACTKLTGPDGYRGLGHVDSRKDTLTIHLGLFEDATEMSKDQQLCNISQSPKSKQKRSKKSIDIEIEIAQDKTALRSRRGDTGSVVWRASVEFCRTVLHQYFFPSGSTIFDYRRLSECNCLELGAGTGLLGIALSPLFRAYTATDIAALLPLIRKNVTLNSRPNYGAVGSQCTDLIVEELDWLTLASLPSGPSRIRYCPLPGPSSTLNKDNTWDLILAADCIYHPSLLRPFVDTIEALATPGRTWVIVVVELRQEDVIREFLNLWLTLGNWEITRVEGFLDENYAIWAGHRNSPTPTV
ncbi:hypothetical protein F5J12DRAFT_821664 [Pisolithus orientalis]|uniref:uncharacterized protein n=1 Tax=Pisolithus orientalis TaxID=936130 RepID=UPI0022253EDB|nr:uncharacterized protein F5J12DRAFT_821664 [Pisolithus orientalis]KAI6010774.1 hypothetical protein F5J12DRAFT_821664 [Pisolithus orientalis]